MASKKYTICVDVGNSETHLGLFEGDDLMDAWTLTTPARATADEVFMQLSNLGLAGLDEDAFAILACVVPSLMDAWTSALDSLPSVSHPFVVGPGMKTGLPMQVNDPAEIGADRIADCVAAKELYGAPVILVDLGTTTNINVIGKNGSFLGGIIAPGMRTSAAAAFSAAAQLSAVSLSAPASVIGKSTREAMQSGIVLGEASRIDGLINVIEDELGYQCQIVMTGSDASIISPLLASENHVDEDLTLQGLHLICQKNAKKK